jgi:hypothetical protein
MSFGKMDNPRIQDAQRIEDAQARMIGGGCGDITFTRTGNLGIALWRCRCGQTFVCEMEANLHAKTNKSLK